MQNYNSGQNGLRYNGTNTQDSSNTPTSGRNVNTDTVRRPANPYARVQSPAPNSNDQIGPPEFNLPASPRPVRMQDKWPVDVNRNLSEAATMNREQVPMRRSTIRKSSQGAVWGALLRLSSFLLAIVLIAIGLWFGIPTMLDFNAVYGIAVILVSVLTALCEFASAQLLIRIWHRI